MDIIKASIERPIAVVAAIFMTIVLGFIALERIPIQLAPDVNTVSYTHLTLPTTVIV